MLDHDSFLLWALIYSFYKHTLFLQDAVFRKLYEKMEYFSGFDAMDQVKDGHFAYISYETFLKNLEAKMKAEPNWKTEVSDCYLWLM